MVNSIQRTTYPISNNITLQRSAAKPTKKFSSRLRNSTVYQTLLGSPGKKFWTAAATLNVSFLGSFFADNISLVTNTALAGDFAGALLYATHMASFSFFTILAATMPIVSHLGKLFLKPDAKPAIPADKDLPPVTVQIPCRNEPLSVVVENALGSALALDYPAEKLQIQVLDNSDPGKYEELAQYCKEHNVTFIHRDGTEGAKARNLNIGLARATGDYVLMFDADNRAKPDFLKNLASEITKDPSLAYVFASVDYWNKNQNPFTKCIGAVNMEFRSTQWTLDKYGMAPFNGYGVLLDRQKMAEVGSWDEKMVGEDWDLALRLYAAGYKGKRVSHTHVHDAIPENLTRYKVQQRRWAFGSSQNIYGHFKEIVSAKNIQWNEKLDLLYRFSYYPGVSALMLLPALLTAPLAVMCQINEGGEPSNLCHWWLAAWTMSTAQPFLSYIANKFSGLFSKSKKSLRYFFPGILTSMGALPEVAKGVLSFIRGNNEGFRITPKGESRNATFFQTLRKHVTELLLGAGVIGSSILNPGYIGIFIFIGLGLFLSPFVSWIGERRPVYTTPGIENFTKQEPPVPLTS